MLSEVVLESQAIPGFGQASTKLATQAVLLGVLGRNSIMEHFALQRLESCALGGRGLSCSGGRGCFVRKMLSGFSRVPLLRMYPGCTDRALPASRFGTGPGSPKDYATPQ